MQPILIIGAGPVGLTMAAELARYRVPVRIIDRSPKATHTSKALVIWSRTLELMDRMGCTSEFLNAGFRAHDATMRVEQKVLGRVSFDGIASPYAFALMIPQADTERLLTAHLHTLGVTIERNTELCDFTEFPDHMMATLRHTGGGDKDERAQNGHDEGGHDEGGHDEGGHDEGGHDEGGHDKGGCEELVQTPWLIGCDGAHSTVRRRLALDFEGHAEPDDWMLADVRLTGEPDPVATGLANYLHRDGPLVMFPMLGGRVRIVACVGRTDPAHPRPEPNLAEVQALLDRRAGTGLTVSDPVWLSNFRINERKVAHYRHGRAFLAGDAAHIHSPAGGQGMNTGMQDAINLAWKLAMVVHGTAAPSLLDSYSPERSAVGDMVLRNATRLTQFATLANPAAQAARNFALRVALGLHAVEKGVATTMSEIDIAYGASPLSVGRNAGVRLAPEKYDGTPPGAGDMPRFVLHAADAAKAATVAAQFPDIVEAAPRRPPASRELLLVRPDGYVGLVAGEDKWADAEAYLARVRAA